MPKHFWDIHDVDVDGCLRRFERFPNYSSQSSILYFWKIGNRHPARQDSGQQDRSFRLVLSCLLQDSLGARVPLCFVIKFVCLLKCSMLVL